ncbi:MFS transporter [Granulibacter bethesdensis]|uniref:MFS transporter n=1 Tax=Granulibacter bethesdensis TaxID=364410 RepID=UPI000933AF9D|nr:MFS transporter [Granulibacter bethesdensis]
MRFSLLALAVASFGIGTTEFVIMGLLPDVAKSLDVSIPKAGLLVTGYALAVTFGSPLLAIATARLPRRSTLMGLMGIFILGNILCGLAGNYTLLMLARIFTALAHGAFFGIGSVVASQIVPRHQRAQAVAMMFSGLTLANVLGVPLGTLLGQWAGWRATFWVVSAIGVMAFTALAIWVPAVPAERGVNMLAEFRTLRRPQVLLTMLISVICSVSLFTVYTYITPLLEQVTGFSERTVTIALLLFGVGLTGGNYIGGRLADWRLMPSIVGLLIALIMVLLLFTGTVLDPALAIATMILWGAIAFALVSPLQLRVVDQAVDARNLASTLNQGAFNLGNATGAWLGGLMLSWGFGYRTLPPLGAAIAVLALGLTLYAIRMEHAHTAHTRSCDQR